MRINPSSSRPSLSLVLALATEFSLGAVDHLHGSALGTAADQNKRHASRPADKRSVRPGVCEREAERLVGEKPVRIDRSVRAPKKIHDVPPIYPELPPGTIAQRTWLGEVLIDKSGKIAHVWRVGTVELKSWSPAFDGAIGNAIQQWDFEPLSIQGRPVAVCMTVTVNISPQ